MESWIFFVLISSFIWAITSFIDKIVISKGYVKSPYAYIVLNGLMNVLIVFFLPFFGFQPLTIMQLLSALLFGIFMSAGIIAYYKAVEHDDISNIVILFQLEPVMILLFSFVFLGEVLTKSHLIGFVVILAAGLLVSYKKIEGKFKLGKVFYLMVISGVLISASYLSIKYLYNTTTFWNAFLWSRLANMCAMLVLLVPSIRKECVSTFKRISIKVKGLLGFKMIIDFTSFFVLGFALQTAPISLVNVIGTSVIPLVVFFLGLFSSIYFPSIVREQIDLKSIMAKITAIALVVFGIAIINLN